MLTTTGCMCMRLSQFEKLCRVFKWLYCKDFVIGEYIHIVWIQHDYSNHVYIYIIIEPLSIYRYHQ